METAPASQALPIKREALYVTRRAWFVGRQNRKALNEIRHRLRVIRAAADPWFKGNEARRAYWDEWEYRVLWAADAVHSDEKAFYGLRTIALFSSIAVPSLVGLNLSGAGGTVVRWLTFALSLIAAITTGALTLFRIGDRWLMYRKLKEGLLGAALTLLESSGKDGDLQDKAWAAFTSATSALVADYNRTYEAAVITAVQSSPDNRPLHDRRGG